jgi:phosphoglucosamine mutase
LLNVPVADPGGLEAADAVWAVVRRVEDELGNGGRVLVRASGTEPLVRVMVEAEAADDAVRHADELAGTVRSSLGDS